MSRESSPQSVEAAVEHVRQHGDVIDADPRLHSAVISLAGFVTSAVVAAPVGMYPSNATPDKLLSYAAYIPAGLVTTYAFNKHQKKRRVGRALEAHRTVNGALNEPVDLIRYHTEQGDKGLLLRWYGYDAAEGKSAAHGFVPRARRIISFAREHDIDVVAAHVPEAPKDTVMWHGAVLLTEAKKAPFRNLWDRQAHDDIVLQPVNEFEQLVDVIESETQGTLIEDIVQKLDNRRLNKLHAAVAGQDGYKEGYKQLRRAVAQEIESSSADVSAAVFRDNNGARLRQKVHSEITVSSKGRYMQLDTAVSPDDGVNMLEVGAGNELARLTGAASNEDLLQDLLTDGVRDRNDQELLVGLYLLLEQKLESAVMINGQPDGTDDFSKVGITPLFSRISDRKSFGYEDINIGVHSVAWTFSRIAPILLGVGAGVYLTLINTTAYENEANRYEAYARSHDFKNQYLISHDAKEYQQYIDDPESGHLKINTAIYETMGKMRAADDAVSYAVADFLINNLHATELAKHLPDYAYKSHAQWQAKVRIKDMPVDRYTMLPGNNRIGDVSSGSNKVVYGIESLHGESTAGYWHNNIDTSLQIVDGNAPFDGANIGMASPTTNEALLSLPYSIADIQNTNADYKVKTPYVGAGAESDDPDYYKGISLPIKEYTDLVAARVVDAEHPKRSVSAAILLLSDGTYVYKPQEMNDRLEAAGITKPVLEYWLKNVYTDNMQRKVPDMRALTTFNDAKEMVSKKDLAEIAVQTRVALGLNANASATEVYLAIKNKQYSYTPLARAKLGKVKIDDRDAGEALTEIGELLAKLETMNCNVASMTMLLATLNRPEYLQETGFNNSDGDGALTQQEAHAWLVKHRDGSVVDPTPTTFADGEEPRTTISDDGTPEVPFKLPVSPERGASVLLGGVFALLIVRRRQAIQKQVDAVRTELALSTHGMQRVVAGMEQALYGRPGAAGSLSPLQTQTATVAAKRYTANIPAGQQNAFDEMTATAKLARVILKSNDAAIRRHAARN